MSTPFDGNPLTWEGAVVIVTVDDKATATDVDLFCDFFTKRASSSRRSSKE